MNDSFVERIARTRTDKGKKVSGGMVETKSQKAMLEAEVHPHPAILRTGKDMDRKGVETESWRVNLLR